MLIESITEEKLSGITLLYGPSSVGKTTLCLQELRGRAVYVSTHKNFDVTRLRTMRADADALLAKLALFEPTSLAELERDCQAAAKLAKLADIIIIDSLATFLRGSDKKLANLTLKRILDALRGLPCPVLITSEVYDSLKDSSVHFMGGDMLRLTSRTILELSGGTITIRKHPIHTGRVWEYQVVDGGLEKI